MASRYPDVNKTWTGDTALCWAASAANALAWTGWNRRIAAARGAVSLSEYDLYLIFKTEMPEGVANTDSWPINAAEWILKRHEIDVPLLDVAQVRPVHDLFLAPDYITGHNCAVLSIYPDSDEVGHALTVYEATGDAQPAANDPRSFRSCVYTDSDDYESAERELAVLSYDVSARVHRISYDDASYIIREWTYFKQNPDVYPPEPEPEPEPAE